MAMTRLILIYDISNDRVRGKVADACLDYGLDRIQFSAFAGELSQGHQEELMLKIEDLMGDETGSVQLFPICAQDWAKRLVVRDA